MRPADMATQHLFNTLRMIRNHFQYPFVGQFIEHSSVYDWDLPYRDCAIVALATELQTRDDLDEDYVIEAEEMGFL